MAWLFDQVKGTLFFVKKKVTTVLSSRCILRTQAVNSWCYEKSLAARFDQMTLLCM